MEIQLYFVCASFIANIRVGSAASSGVFNALESFSVSPDWSEEITLPYQTHCLLTCLKYDTCMYIYYTESSGVCWMGGELPGNCNQTYAGIAPVFSHPLLWSTSQRQDSSIAECCRLAGTSQICKSEYIGSEGGGDFTDRNLRNTNGRITAVYLSVKGGNRIYSSIYQYGGVNETHGYLFDSFVRYGFELGDDEFIHSLRITSENNLASAIFYTNKRQYGPYGDVSRGTETFLSAGGYGRLAYISGKHGASFGYMRFHFEPCRF